MARVHFDQITKTFDDTTAVADLTLDIADGEFLVLLGPSGCGKSTALRMLAGLESPTSGSIRIGDAVVNDIDPRHRDVAMVFQSYALYPHMSVAKNIESPLIGRGTPKGKAERAALVHRAASMLGLADLLKRKPAQLSGGQRQRVALARAIVREPAVFCMDEPLSNLDAKLRQETRTELVNLHRELATTFVYVTHDQVEAMTMATRIAILDQGRLQQVGSPREIYEQPANVFVARFIGSPAMNVVTGQVRGVGADRFIAVGTGRLPLGSTGPDLADGETVLVGARPEDLALTDDSAAIAIEVVNSEWLGHEHIITAVVPQTDTRIVVRDTGDATELRTGDTAYVTVDPDALHIFDPESEVRR